MPQRPHDVLMMTSNGCNRRATSTCFGTTRCFSLPGKRLAVPRDLDVCLSCCFDATCILFLHRGYCLYATVETIFIKKGTTADLWQVRLSMEVLPPPPLRGVAWRGVAVGWLARAAA